MSPGEARAEHMLISVTLLVYVHKLWRGPPFGGMSMGLPRVNGGLFSFFKDP